MTTGTAKRWMNVWALFAPKGIGRAEASPRVHRLAAVSQPKVQHEDEAPAGRWVVCVVPGATGGTFPTGGCCAPLD